MHQHTTKVHTHQHAYIYLYLPMPFLYTFFCGLKIQTHTLKKKNTIYGLTENIGSFATCFNPSRISPLRN